MGKKKTVTKRGIKKKDSKPTKRKAPVVLQMQHIILILLFVIGSIKVFDLFPGGSTRMTNVASRLMTVDSLVHRGTFYINESPFNTIDKYQLDEEGHLLSTKPPVLPTIGAGFYWSYWKLTGNSLATETPKAFTAITFFMSFIPHVIFLVFFYKLLLLIIKQPHARILTYLAIVFGYIGAIYARAINNHIVAACFLLVAFYYAFRIRNEKHSRKLDWILAGFFSGFFPTIDLPSVIFSIAIFLYLLMYDYKKTLLYFLPASLPPLFFHFYLMFISSGNILPMQFKLNKILTLGKDSGVDFAKMVQPMNSRLNYVWNMTFGHHGIFAFTPVLLLGLFELIRQLIFRKAFWREALVVLLPFVALFLFYALLTDNYGGTSVGFRWLIPPMPLIILFAGLIIDKKWSIRALPISLLFVFLIAVGLHQNENSGRPWMNSRWQSLYERNGIRAYPILYKQVLFNPFRIKISAK